MKFSFEIKLETVKSYLSGCSESHVTNTYGVNWPENRDMSTWLYLRPVVDRQRTIWEASLKIIYSPSSHLSAWRMLISASTRSIGR